MDERLRNFYLETRVKSASPSQLLLLLYEKLVEKAENAEQELAAAPNTPERIQAPTTVSHCINIITELSTSLRHDADPDLCATLSNLYAFFARQFAQALATSDAGKIGAILPLIRELRTAWTQAEKMSGNSKLVAAAA